MKMKAARPRAAAGGAGAPSAAAAARVPRRRPRRGHTRATAALRGGGDGEGKAHTSEEAGFPKQSPQQTAAQVRAGVFKGSRWDLGHHTAYPIATTDPALRRWEREPAVAA